MPPRNWRRWGWAYALHALYGVSIAVLCITGWWAVGLGLALGYIAYQWFSYQRKRQSDPDTQDTPGRDIKDCFFAGALPVTLAGWLYLVAWPVVQGWMP